MTINDRKLTADEILTLARKPTECRRGDESKMQSPTLIGIALDTVTKLLSKPTKRRVKK